MAEWEVIEELYKDVFIDLLICGFELTDHEIKEFLEISGIGVAIDVELDYT
jgi:hypothetical protein